MKVFTYKTSGTCSKSIEIQIEGDIIENVRFEGGCNGNTKGIASLVKSMKIQQVIDKLRGIDCNNKGTSCPDQLAIALTQIQKESLQNK